MNSLTYGTTFKILPEQFRSIAYLNVSFNVSNYYIFNTEIYAKQTQTKKQGLYPIDEFFLAVAHSTGLYLTNYSTGKLFFLLTNPQFVLLLKYLYKIKDQRTVDTEVQVSFCLYLFPLGDVAKDAWNSV